MTSERNQGVSPTGPGHSDEPASSLAANAGSVPNARHWQSWERNFSGGRLGVQEQQGVNENWMILHVESGGAKTTTSLRHHEAWDLALMLSPQLKARLGELSQRARTADAALYSLTWRSCETDLLRKIADEWTCGDGCPHAGMAHCSRAERDGCKFADADAMRELATGIDYANATVEADVLRAIDSCGGSRGPETQEWSDGYNAALDAAGREVRRLFSKAQGMAARSGETGTGSTEGNSPVRQDAPEPETKG